MGREKGVQFVYPDVRQPDGEADGLASQSAGDGGTGRHVFPHHHHHQGDVARRQQDAVHEEEEVDVDSHLHPPQPRHPTHPSVAVTTLALRRSVKITRKRKRKLKLKLAP